MFPLPSSTTNGHPIFRGPVRRASASVTRFFVMLHSSPSPRGRRAIIARNLSPVGVRLSGAIRPSSDVIQKVRRPPGGEELGKNTRRASPIYWNVWASHLAAMRTLCRRFLADCEWFFLHIVMMSTRAHTDKCASVSCVYPDIIAVSSHFLQASAEHMSPVPGQSRHVFGARCGGARRPSPGDRHSRVARCGAHTWSWSWTLS